MKIQEVQSVLLSYPLPEPLRLPFYGGERTILKRDAMLIRVSGEQGLIGYAPGPGSAATQARIEGTVKPFLEGRHLADPDALRVQFTEITQDREMHKAYCAVEFALYDLLGQAFGVPISELIGGRVRDRIRLYGSAGMYLTPDGLAQEVAGIAGLGFKGYKMRPALGPDQDLEAVRGIRKATGPDFEIMVDGHSWWRMGDRSYSYDAVAQLAGSMARENIAWLEEPLPPEDHDAYRRLNALDLLPLASGEHEQSEESYLDLIEGDCVEYVQMDVCCQGGIAMGRRLLAEVARENLRFAFHSWGTSLEVLAAAHLGVCWADNVIPWLEFPCYSAGKRPGMYPFPLADEILREPLPIAHGDLEVPRGPGLGISVDETVADRYPWIPGPWSFFRTDSPPQTRAVTSDHSIQWET